MGKERTLKDAHFLKLRQIIYERSGIYFAENKKYILESRLTHRLEELDIDDFDQYLMLLSVGPYRDDEFQEMFNRITINETSFFRNEPQLLAFEKRILPELLEARKTTRRLRIWSAACSTGEEPFTLAIMLHRTLGLRLGDWNIEILGTDISAKALMTAQQARYTTYSIRTTDPLIIKRYFTQNGGFYQILPELQKMVSFELLNLKDGFAARRHGTWDVIFCRNVMIYFDQQMRDHCEQLFNDMLAPDGTLLLGHSETLNGSKLFVNMGDPQAFAWNRINPARRTAWRVLGDGQGIPTNSPFGIKAQGA